MSVDRLRVCAAFAQALAAGDAVDAALDVADAATPVLAVPAGRG